MVEDNVQKNDSKNKIKAIIKEYLINLIIIGGMAVIILKFIVYPVYIPSKSMVPTLNVKDMLFVTKVYKPENLQRGNIITFRCDEYGSKLLIKRLIGLPGDNVQIVNGAVYINGKALDEPYVVNNEEFDGVYVVPEGKYFVLGDNRANSDDSRYWHNSFVDADGIDGKILIRWYPFNEAGRVN